MQQLIEECDFLVDQGMALQTLTEKIRVALVSLQEDTKMITVVVAVAVVALQGLLKGHQGVMALMPVLVLVLDTETKMRDFQRVSGTDLHKGVEGALVEATMVEAVAHMMMVIELNQAPPKVPFAQRTSYHSTMPSKMPRVGRS